MAYFETLAELSARAGQTVAASDWVEITQQHIDLFAEATGDRQWIHAVSYTHLTLPTKA